MRSHGLGNAVAAEWTKLWSIRVPYACLLVGLAVTVIFTFYYASLARIHDEPLQALGNAPAASVVLGQFVVVVLAMTMVTAEYATGSVRTSLLWVPVRDRMQLAKSLVAAVVAFIAGVGFSVLGMAVAWSPFRGHARFDAVEAVSQVFAMGLYHALIAVLAVGISFALRTAAGSLPALFVLLYALPGLCDALGGPFLLACDDYLPQTAGGYFTRADGAGAGDAPYPPPVAIVILAAWAITAHLAGRGVLRRRDA
ncbi:ABC transporter permease [Embleya sp. NPDC001921]